MPLHDSMLLIHGCHDAPKTLFSFPYANSATTSANLNNSTIGISCRLHVYRRCALPSSNVFVPLVCNANPPTLSPGTSYAIARQFGMALTRIFPTRQRFVALVCGISGSPHLPSTHRLHITTTSKCCHTSESWNSPQPS